MKLRKADVSELLKISYPDYKGRKFKVSIKKEYYLKDYWSGGSRTYAKFAKFVNDHWEVVTNPFTNPYKDSAHVQFNVPNDIIIIEHIFFCGKDLGINFVVSPNFIYLPKLLEKGN